MEGKRMAVERESGKGEGVRGGRGGKGQRGEGVKR